VAFWKPRLACTAPWPIISGSERHAGGNRPYLTSLSPAELWIVRIAALLHDIGHGPFSHAVEPVIRVGYSDEITEFNKAAREAFNLDTNLGVAEIIAVLIVVSPALRRVFEHGSFPKPGSTTAAELQFRIAILIMGGRHQHYNVALSGIISGQVDADKLDYMARDALHSGMPISFDTERLLRKLEIISCTPDSLPPARTDEDRYKIDFARSCDRHEYLEIGILPSGVGALEQMLVGRAFLYDRLYYHHKVRAADAMAQRLLMYARPTEDRQFTLKDLYLDVDDDTLIRLLGGLVTTPQRPSPGEGASDLAKDILGRRLYHRAVAFRARFHHAGEHFDMPEQRTDMLAGIWSPLSSDLSEFDNRFKFEKQIYEEAKCIAPLIGESRMIALAQDLRPWHVVVDLPENRVKAVSIYVYDEDDTLDLPNLFFDPARWSQVYDLEKRTGYVFCPQRYISLVALAAKVLLFEKWGYVASEKADRLTKTIGLVPNSWYEQLRDRGYIDDTSLWPAPGSEDTELGVLIEPEVGHGETEVYPRVQA
jgi:hypothetical protein